MGFLELTREEKVAQFVTAAGKTPYNFGSIDHSVLDCIREEVQEFFDAVNEYEDTPCDVARAQLCKEWADMQYVISQAAWYFDIPADPSFNRVHDNNMTKVVDGKVIRAENGKILKPANYQPADMQGL